MKLWWQSDKRDRSGGASDEEPDKRIQLTDLDPVDVNQALKGSGPLVQSDDGVTRIFGKFSSQEIQELMEWSGIFDALREKGYNDFHLDLQYLSDLDQRIYVKHGEENLIHIRLKLSDFRFRLHPGAPTKKLIYIDWLMTRHPRARVIRPQRLFPGQDMPGLGIFGQISDFITNLGIGVGAKGAFNIPEYFHDALLFHRQFNFYDPGRESFFRALIRDLRGHGAREISNAFSEERIRDAKGEVVSWSPGEMLSALEPSLDHILWTPDYHTKVVRGLKRYKFTIEKA